MNPFNPQLDVNASTFNKIYHAHAKHDADQADQIQGRSWLKNSHPLGENEEISWKLFANLAGDGHIKDTPLEGCQLKESLSYFQHVIGSVLTEEGKQNKNFAFASSHRKELETFVEDLKGAITIAKGIDRLIEEGDSRSAKEQAKLIQDDAEELSQQFKKKKMGWIPCGWQSKNGAGHAIMAFVNAEKGTLTLVNSGAGIDKHHPCITETKQDPLTGEVKEEVKYQEFITITSLDKERLLSKDFFTILLELQVRPIWDGQLDFDEENIYHPLIQYLKGRVEVAKSPFNHPDLFKKPQRSGTCTIKGVSTSLYYTLCHAFRGFSKNEREDVNCYKKIKYFLQTQALVSIVNKLDTSLTESQYLLLHDTMDNLARSAEKLYEKKLLADEDLADLQATLLDIREKLATLNTKEEKVEDCAEVASLTTESGQLFKNENVIQADTSELSQAKRHGSFFRTNNKNLLEECREIFLPNTQMELPKDRLNAEDLKKTIADFRSQFKNVLRWKKWLEVFKVAKNYHEFLDRLLSRLDIQDDSKKKDFLQITKIFFYYFQDPQRKKELRKICEQQFAQFITALPRPSKERDSYWNQIEEHQISPLMEEIYQLMADYKCIISCLSEEREAYTPDSTVLLFSLFAINTQLAYRLPETKLEGFKVSCDDLLFQIKSPYFIVTNPKIQERLDDTINYFIPDFKLESLNRALSIRDLEDTLKSHLFSFKDFVEDSFLVPNMTVDKKSMKSDPTLIYFIQFLEAINKDPKLQSKFYRGNVSRQSSKREQLAALMTEAYNSDSLLPASVHALLQSSLLCTTHVYKNSHPGRVDYATTELRSVPIGEKSLKISNKHMLSVRIRDDISDESLATKPEHVRGRIKINSHIADMTKHVGQNDLIPRQRIFPNQSLEDSRNIEMIGGDPYEEFARTIAFINNYVLLLKEKGVQEAIRIHLFRPLRLLSQLRDEPAMLRFFSKAIGKAITHYRYLEDWETCLFLAKLGNDVKIFAKDYESDTMMQDFRAVILNEIVPRCKRGGSERVKSYQILASFYENIDGRTIQNDPDLLKQLTEDMIVLKILSSIYGTQGNSVEDLPRLEAYVNKHLPTLKSIDPILNNVLKAVCFDKKEYHWEGEYPVYECEAYCIDVQQWGITDKEGGLLSKVPERVFEDATFKKVFKGIIETCEKNPETHTYVINKGLEDELIVKDNGIKPKFERTINGQRLHYLDTPDILSVQIPTLFSQNVHCWIHDGDHPEILGLQEGRVPVVNVKLEKMPNASPSQYRITRIYPFIREANTVDESKSWIPFSRAPKLVKSLERIEHDVHHIECWQRDPGNHHDGSDLQEVKLPRFGLSFAVKEVEGKKYLFSKQFPGYYLIESSQPKALEGINRFLTIQNMAGERKILLPKTELQVRFENDPFDRKIEQQVEFDKSVSWLEYSVKDGKLAGHNIESQFYLVYLFAARGDVDKALNLLKKITPLDRIIDDPESGNTALSVIRMMFARLVQDESTAAKALLLHLALFLHENQLKYPLPIHSSEKNDSIDFKIMAEAYQSYFSNPTNFPSLRLSIEEEKKVLTILFDRKKYFEKKWKARKHYLEKGVANLGTKTVNCFPEQEKTSISSEELAKKFREQNQEASLPEFFIQDENFFSTHFFSLYRIIETGSKAEKEKLHHIIDINSHLNTPYYTLIKTISRYSWRYPSLSRLNHAKSWRNFMFDRITGGQIWRIISSVALQVFYLCRTVCFPSSKFSVGTQLYERLAEPFKKKFLKKHRTEGNRGAILNCDGKGLEETDLAFDRYFKELLNHYFNVHEIPVADEAVQLPTSHPDKNIERKFLKENEELEHYRASRSKVQTTYALKAGLNLKDFQNELEGKVQTFATRLKVQKAALLWQLNDIPQGTDEQNRKHIHKAGFRNRLTWEDLRELTLKGDMELFKEKTYLSEEEVKRLLVGASDYLITSTRVEQMNKILNTLQKAQSMEDDDKKKLLLQNVAKSLQIARAYDPAPEHINRQWFEYANRYHYRQAQLEKLEAITDANHGEILAEMPTGFGKTKALIPSANFKKGKENHLVFNVWPSSLEMQNAVDIREQMSRSYGKKVDRFTFDRTSAFSTKSLKHLYEELKKDQKEGSPINVRSESLRALELHALLILDRASKWVKDMDELKMQIGYFLKILRLIRTEGWSTIDESHVVLNPKDKLIYAIGNPEVLPSKHVEIIEEFFAVLTEGKLDALLKIAENQQSFCSEENYEKNIAPLLAEYFAKKFNIDEKNRESYKSFVLNKTDNIPQWIKKSKLKEQIALVKGMLAHVLKATLKGSVDENFGLSKLHISSKEYAISYSSANTPKETKTSPSQFKNLHETLCKTYITYLHKGLSADQFKKFFASLKADVLKEVKDKMPLDRTQAFKFYSAICPEQEKPLTTLNDKDIEELFVSTDLRRNKEVLFYYIRTIVVPQLKHYSTSLISTVHNFRSQFAGSTSLSATPQDTSTHGPDTVFIPMRGTSGQVTHLLLTKCSDPKTIHEIQSIKAANALEETIDSVVKKNPKIHAMIDIGAQFKGLSNHDVASKLRDKFQADRDVEAILFFDENAGLFKMMDTASGQIHDPSETHIDPDLAQTFFDQNRCFGSDVAQAEDGVGLMTVGKDTTKAAVGQGAGRMRLWHQGQSVEVAYPAALKDEIFENQEPNISKLLVYWTMNQQKQEAEKNYQSQLEQMANEIRRVLLDAVLGICVGKDSKTDAKEPDVDRAIELLKRFQSEFFSDDSLNPWEMYAAMSAEKETRQCLRSYQEEHLKKVQNLKGLKSGERDFISKRLGEYLKKWEEMNLPATVKASPRTLGMECEVLQEVETEVQAYTAEEIPKREPSIWPEQLDLFKPGWEKPRKQWFALKNLTNAIYNSPPVKTVKKNLTEDAGVLTVATLIGILSITTFALPIIWAIGTFIATFIASAFLSLVIIGFTKQAISFYRVKDLFFSRTNTIYRVKDLMLLYLPKKLQKTSKVFSSNFLVSNNFYVQNTQSFAEAAQKPFDLEQKPLYSVLVIMDEMGNGKKNIKVMAIDQNDSVFFHRKLKHDKKTTSGEQAAMRKRKVGIYDLSSEIFTVQGANKFDAKDLSNPAFRQLIGEAKFLNGDVDYSEEELKHFGSHLQKVAKDVGYNILQSLFCDHILKFHSSSRRLMQNKEELKPIARLLGLA